MELVRRFLSQSNKEYRDFQLVYGLLGAHFFVAGLWYLLFPDSAVEGFVRLGTIVGSEIYPLYERSYMWRILAATNVLTLGFLCAFIQADVRRHWPAVYPLLFMKGATAVSYLCVYVFILHYPAFLMVASWDTLNCAAFLYYGQKGRKASMAGDDGLVPRPLAAL